jgi:hypothetical protein
MCSTTSQIGTALTTLRAEVNAGREFLEACRLVADARDTNPLGAASQAKNQAMW